MSRVFEVRGRRRAENWSVASAGDSPQSIMARGVLIGALAIAVVAACLWLVLRPGTASALVASAARLDRAALAALNGYAGQSWTLDTLVWAIGSDYAIQGGLMLAMFWWAWFAAGDTAEGVTQRQTVLSSLLGLYVAVMICLVIRDGLAFRPRPAEDVMNAFRMPFLPAGVTLSRETSSFPSGHATVFFALATGLWWISPVLGVAGVLHATFIDCLPRMYLGYHYPSDIIAGAILGTLTVSLLNTLVLRRAWMARVVVLSRERAALFYSTLLLLSVETATEFASVRTLLKLLSTSQIRKLVMH